MQKRSDSLRGIGFTTVSVDSITKERMKELAGDTPICEFVRDMVNDYAGKNPQVPMPVGTSAKDRELQKVDKKLEALSSMLELALYKLMTNSIDDNPDPTFKELVRIVDAAGIKVGRWFKELNAEQGRLLNDVA